MSATADLVTPECTRAVKKVEKKLDEFEKAYDLFKEKCSLEALQKHLRYQAAKEKIAQKFSRKYPPRDPPPPAPPGREFDDEGGSIQESTSVFDSDASCPPPVVPPPVVPPVESDDDTQTIEETVVDEYDDVTLPSTIAEESVESDRPPVRRPIPPVRRPVVRPVPETVASDDASDSASDMSVDSKRGQKRKPDDIPVPKRPKTDRGNMFDQYPFPDPGDPANADWWKSVCGYCDMMRLAQQPRQSSPSSSVATGFSPVVPSRPDYPSASAIDMRGIHPRYAEWDRMYPYNPTPSVTSYPPYIGQRMPYDNRSDEGVNYNYNYPPPPPRVPVGCPVCPFPTPYVDMNDAPDDVSSMGEAPRPVSTDRHPVALGVRRRDDGSSVSSASGAPEKKKVAVSVSSSSSSSRSSMSESTDPNDHDYPAVFSGTRSKIPPSNMVTRSAGPSEEMSLDSGVSEDSRRVRIARDGAKVENLVRVPVPPRSVERIGTTSLDSSVDLPSFAIPKAIYSPSSGLITPEAQMDSLSDLLAWGGKEMTAFRVPKTDRFVGGEPKRAPNIELGKNAPIWNPTGNLAPGGLYLLRFAAELRKTPDGRPSGPGRAFGAAVLYDPSGEEYWFGYKYFGKALTDNIASYAALIYGLKSARALGVNNLIIETSSNLIDKQLNGGWKIENNTLRKLVNIIQDWVAPLSYAEARWIQSTTNARARWLAVYAADQDAEGVSPSSATDRMNFVNCETAAEPRVPNNGFYEVGATEEVDPNGSSPNPEFWG